MDRRRRPGTAWGLLLLLCAAASRPAATDVPAMVSLGLHGRLPVLNATSIETVWRCDCSARCPALEARAERPSSFAHSFMLRAAETGPSDTHFLFCARGDWTCQTRNMTLRVLVSPAHRRECAHDKQCDRRQMDDAARRIERVGAARHISGTLWHLAGDAYDSYTYADSPFASVISSSS